MLYIYIGDAWMHGFCGEPFLFSHLRLDLPSPRLDAPAEVAGMRSSKKPSLPSRAALPSPVRPLIQALPVDLPLPSSYLLLLLAKGIDILKNSRKLNHPELRLEIRVPKTLRNATVDQNVRSLNPC